LTYEQAQTWFKPELHAWFLIGLKKCRDHTLPVDLCCQISSFVFNISTHDANVLLQRHMHVVPKKLRDMELDLAAKRLRKSGDLRDETNQFTLSLPGAHTLFATTPEKESALEQYNKDKESIMQKYKKRISL